MDGTYDPARFGVCHRLLACYGSRVLLGWCVGVFGNPDVLLAFAMPPFRR